MVSDGLRDSCASHWLAAVKFATQITLEMGNSPKKLLSDHRELVTGENPMRNFEILPIKARPHF